MKYISILIGGASGALLRYYVSILPYKYINTSFPIGTFIVNILGSFFIGFLWGISENILIPSNIRFLIFTGFIGAFTTFSTYALESFRLIQNGQFRFAITNIILSPIIGLIGVFIGYMLAKGIFYIKLYFV